MAPIDRPAVLNAFLQRLSADRAALLRAVSAARADATGAESVSENKYDTRATEASYLAAGQGQRLEELDHSIAWFQTVGARASPVVGLGSLVAVEGDGDHKVLLIAVTGGVEVQVDDQTIAAVSRGSALGAALLGLTDGDAAQVRTPRGTREWEVLWVS